MASEEVVKEKMVTRRNKDLQDEFEEVEEVVAMEFQAIQFLHQFGLVIPVPIKGETLAKLTEYCKKRVTSSSTNDVDQATPGDLIMAANIKGPYDLTRQEDGDLTVKRIIRLFFFRKIFNTENGFTPEEVKAIRKENQGALISEEEEEVFGDPMVL